MSRILSTESHTNSVDDGSPSRSDGEREIDASLTDIGLIHSADEDRITIGCQDQHQMRKHPAIDLIHTPALSPMEMGTAPHWFSRFHDITQTHGLRTQPIK